MKILVFSDSHGKGERMREIIEKSDADTVLFLGDGIDQFYRITEGCDKMTVAVKGNCDLFDGTPEERFISLDGVNILMLHGHTRGAKGGTGALEGLGVRLGADVILYGHTHIPDNRYVNGADKPYYVFNPGSIGSYSPTFGYIETVNGKAVLNVCNYEGKM